MAGTPLATAFVRVRPDTSTFKRETELGVSKAGSGMAAQGQKLGRAFGSAFTSFAVKAIAVIGGVDLFGKMISAGEEAAKVTAATNAVIKSTGGVAKVSAAQVQSLADAMMRKTGIDDETIRAGANMLLTFTRIRNEVGRGNDIFTQATSVLADMSAAMHGGDVSSESLRKTAIQLGKALQDPVKGVTALRRVGVMLTDQQTEQVKALVASGNVMGAQKVILAELTREFGGSAAAYATPLSRLKTATGELAESAGTLLLPAVSKVADVLSYLASGPVTGAVTTWFGKLSGIIRTGFRALVSGETLQPPAIKSASMPKAPDVPAWERFLIAVRGVAVEVGKAVWPSFRGLLGDLGRFMHTLWTVTQNVWTVIQPFAAALGKLAVGAIVAGFRALSVVLNLVGAVLRPVTSWMAQHKTLVGSLAVAIGVLVVAMNAWRLGMIAWTLYLKAAAIVGRAFAIVQWLINAALTANPIGLIVVALAALAAAFVWAWTHSETFRKIVIAAWDAVKGAALAVVNWFKTDFVNFFTVTLPGVWNTVTSSIRSAWDGMVQALRTAFAWVVDKILGYFGAILHGAAVMFGWVPGVGDKLRAADVAFQQFRDNVNNSLLGINSRTVTVTAAFQAAGVTSSVYRSQVPGAATGGLLRGPGGPTADRIPIWASNREYVMSAAAVDRYGVSFFDALNARRLAGGGLITAALVPTAASIGSAIWSKVGDIAARMMQLAFSVGAPGVGGGVMRWSGLVLQVLAMLGQSAAWLGTVLARMQQESGGNPWAINLWDVNAQRGDPSRGLMQTIGSTFNAYAGPFLSRGIFDPLANIYAGLNYALHRYGTLAALARPGGYFRGGLVSFGRGGLLTEPVVGTGTRSGRGYRFAESGPEEIVPAGETAALLRKILDELRKQPASTARAVSAALGGVGRSAVVTR